MFNSERQSAILAYIKQKPSVSVAELSQQFGVSAVTIRKDLNELSASGYIERTHGGAVMIQKSRFEENVQERFSVNSESKQQIARKAADLVEEGSTIILDAGSTTLEMAKILKERAIPDVTIITHALTIADLFRDDDHYDLVLVGGQYRRGIFSFVGPLAIQMFRQLHADRGFMGINGYTLEDGLTTPSPFEAEMKRMIIQRSTEAFLVADTGKYGTVCMSRVAEVTDLDGIITDSAFPDQLRKAMEEREVRVI